LIGPMDIAAINIDDAIPVEEERALRHGPFSELRTSDGAFKEFVLTRARHDNAGRIASIQLSAAVSPAFARKRINGPTSWDVRFVPNAES
jgi:hypothetical protein